MKRTKHFAGSLMTVVALVRRNYVKNLSKKNSDPIQSNPIFSTRNWTQSNPIQSNPTQSMDESNPCPTLFYSSLTFHHDHHQFISENTR